MRKLLALLVVSGALTFGVVSPAGAKTNKPSSTCRSALTAADSLASSFAVVLGHIGDYFNKLSVNASSNSGDVQTFISTLTNDTSSFNTTVTTDQVDVRSAVSTYKGLRDSCLAGR